MRNIFLSLAAILIASLIAILPTQIALANEESDKHNEQGEKYYYDGKYEDAIKEFKSAIAIEINNPEYHNNLGIAYSMLGNYDDALKECNLAISINQNEPLYYENRAYVYKTQGDSEKAYVRAYEAQKENKEANESSYKVSDELVAHMADWKPILNKDRYKEIYDKAAKDFLTAGKIYFNNENYDKAKEALNNAIIANGSGLIAVYNDPFKAGDVENLVEGEAHFWLGEIESRLSEKNLSDWKEAIRHYSLAISLGFTEDFVYTSRGYAKYKLKDYDAAIKNFDKALEIDVTHTNAYKWRGEIYYELNEFEKARDDFQKYLDFYGKNLDEETKQSYEYKIADSVRFFVFLSCSMALWRDSSPQLHKIYDTVKSLNAKKQFELTLPLKS